MQPDGQTAFTHAIFKPDDPIPQGIVDPEGRIPPKRFAVYRNNVTVSLTEALSSVFPAVVALIGEENFKALARQFIRSNPPSSPLIMEYGRDFPDFLARIEALEHLPFLPDVARLERLWLDAYHEADADPIGPQDFAGLDEEALLALKVRVHPATRLFVSDFPVHAIWVAAKGEEPSVASEVGQGVLITRPDFSVETRAVSKAEAEFLTQLFSGADLGTAAEAAGFYDAEALGAALSILISSGACAGLSSGGTK